jgi:hypothetical protein
MSRATLLCGLATFGLCGVGIAGCNDYVACAGSTFFDGAAIASEWEWTAGEVISIPLVADVDGDGAPDVVVVASRIDGEDWDLGELVLIDGRTGKEKWRIRHEPAAERYGAHGRATPALADVDGDELPDIIYAGREDIESGLSQIHAVDGDGELVWTAVRPSGVPEWMTVGYAAPAVANLDDDPEAEIVIGVTVIDNDGRVGWSQDGDGGRFGAPVFLEGAKAGQSIYTGALSTLADLDGDGRPEIVSGREAWAVEWIDYSDGPDAFEVTPLWRNFSGRGNDGWPAVADLDGDGTPEVVLTAWPEIRVIDGRTGLLWCGADPSGAACDVDSSARTQPIAIKGGNLGGPATIADFDGDGRPEVGIAGGGAYAVYDFNRPGEEIVGLPTDPPPDPGAMFVRWTVATQDQSSASTGASAFDFDGDGAFELAYQDECNVRVLSGIDGTVLFEQVNSSATGHEYPVVVDVDGDGATEIVVAANMSLGVSNTDCEQTQPGFVARQGLFVYGAGEQRWVPARPVWTQHTQHGTDVDAAGNVPRDEEDHWRVNNGFRQALPADGADEVVCR